MDIEFSRNEQSNNDLEKLGQKHNANKLYHNYLKRYDRYCKDNRLNVKRILEIGVDKGVSLKMWAEYFPNAEIVGVDRDTNCKKFEDNRTKIIITDSSSSDCVNQLVAQGLTEFDVIIDDGSHWYWNQINTFKQLFPYLKNGGHYFVEDVGLPDHPLRYKAFDAFGELINGINYYPEGKPYSLFADQQTFEFPHIKNYWIKNVVGVAFYRFLVVIEKGLNPEDNIYWQIPSKRTEAAPVNLEQMRRKIKLTKAKQFSNYFNLFLMVFRDYNRKFFIPAKDQSHRGLKSVISGFLRMFKQVSFRK